jgi:hypothetical protein
MVTEKYVSFETANLLKEKDFPQNPYKCNTVYTSRGKFSNNAKSFCHNVELFENCEVKPVSYSMAPTIQMANEWLRENHNLMCVSIPYAHEDGIFYAYKVYFLDKVGKGCFVKKQGAGFDEPAEALEDAINYCLNNLV